MQPILPNQLMLGDILRYSNDGTFGKVIEITQDSYKVESLHPAKGYTPTVSLDDHFEAARLNNGYALLCNGFERQGAKHLVLRTDRSERLVRWNIETHELTISRDDSTYERRRRHILVSRFCDDLHSLQHAMHECGIDIDWKL